MIENGSPKQTPLFQLNLFLWLVWYPSIASTGIRPIFREEGFELQAISPLITTPLPVRARASQEGIPIHGGASPDLLLKHSGRLTLLPIECKLNSFGPDRHEAYQATVLLSALGSNIASSLGLASSAKWGSHLSYAVVDGSQSLMLETLQHLSELLENAKIQVIPSSTIGIQISETGVYLQGLPYNDTPIASLHTSEPSQWIQVIKLEEGEDPTPLYLMPVDPTILLDDPKGMIVLERKIRTLITALIGSQLDDEAFEVYENDIMEAAIEVWGYWQDSSGKQALMRSMRGYLDKILGQMRHQGAKIKRHQGRILFTDVTPELADKIRKYLTTRDFRTGQIEWSEQMRFDEDERWQ